MGRCKELQLEEYEKWARGYNPPEPREKFTCASHFGNKYLQRHVERNGHLGTCSYCKKSKTVMDMADFIEYIGNRITSYIGPIDNECLPLANSYLDKEDREEGIPGWTVIGSLLAPAGVEFYEDTQEVMEDYDLVTDNDDLDEDIAECFNVDQWIRKDPAAMLLHEELYRDWSNFSHMVKTKLRYSFFRSQEYSNGSGESIVPGSDIIGETAHMVRSLEDRIDVGTLLYRGRPEDKQAPFEDFTSLTAPPVEAAKENRMSPYGISMFYGSYDKDTPIEEIKNYLEDKDTRIYLGEFEVTRILKVINLCNIPQPDFWMENESDWQVCTFLHAFHKEISKPVGTKDPKLEYIPSQVFCEYLRHIQKTKDGSSYDGIVYSSAMTSAKNVVLFYDNKTSEGILQLNEISTIEVPEKGVTTQEDL
jgi:RES domain-containing protein